MSSTVNAGELAESVLFNTIRRVFKRNLGVAIASYLFLHSFRTLPRW